MAGLFRWKIAQKAELQWWKRYLAEKDVLPYLEWKRGYWQQLLDICSEYFTIVPEHRILDAGCGPAGIFIALTKYPAVHAFDPLLDNYEANLQHFKKAFYPSVAFYNASLEDFKPTEQFDVIFCLNAINHVKDIGQATTNLTQWLKPGGWLVESIDAHNFGALKHIFRALPGDVLHPHQYDLKEYKAMLEERGCKVYGERLLKKESIFNHYLLLAQKAK